MGEKVVEDPYAITDAAIQEPPQSLWKALAKIGPGIVLAGSIVGSGELILTTSLGADWGFVFLWLVLFSCVIKVFVQIELGRYAISSAQPTLTALNSLPGPRLGASWLVWWWFCMLLASVFQLGAMVGSVGQALNVAFPQVSPAIAGALQSMSAPLAEAIRDRPEHPWSVLTALAAILLLLSGGYKRLEWVTTALVAGVTLITVGCVLLLPSTGYPIRPADIKEGFNVLAIAALPPAAIAAAFSAFGITGVGASELYAYPYWCLEKGYARFTGPRSDDPKWVERAKGWLRVMILDAWVSMVVFTVATVAFYVLGATVLHRRDLHPKGAQMVVALAEMYVPTFGAWTKILFMIGAWAVLFKTLYVASAGHARLSTDFLGLLGAVRFDDPQKRPRWIRRFCVFFPTLALILYLLFREPKMMVTVGGYAQAVTLPVISGAALYLRYFRTDKRLAPSLASDLLLWTAFVLITAVAGYAVYNDVFPTVGGWLGLVKKG
ncbi:MAG TPA: Nramp family divalent metal transporter [Pirellulaceae bacterium]|nr:Nramp family divalent metal transporter [Pirellulaceae bacterium]